MADSNSILFSHRSLKDQPFPQVSRWLSRKIRIRGKNGKLLVPLEQSSLCSTLVKIHWRHACGANPLLHRCRSCGWSPRTWPPHVASCLLKGIQLRSSLKTESRRPESTEFIAFQHQRRAQLELALRGDVSSPGTRNNNRTPRLRSQTIGWHRCVNAINTASQTLAQTE